MSLLPYPLARHFLFKMDPEAAHDLTLPTPQILLCTAGAVRAGEEDLTPGQSVFVPAGEKTEVSGAGTVFRATVIV